jgi:hypothetical protein
MSKLVATLHVYDSHQHVRWAVHVLEYENDKSAKHRTAHTASGSFPSTGDSSPVTWFQDALLDVLHHG